MKWKKLATAPLKEGSASHHPPSQQRQISAVARLGGKEGSSWHIAILESTTCSAAAGFAATALSTTVFAQESPLHTISPEQAEEFPCSFRECFFTPC